ncbi:MAG: hypothetical protein EPN43_12400 [Jatrophihabitans sp.]|nr:MAG: hypothetical protein EPN43_12400 [Jatrophihabitans sp.]
MRLFRREPPGPAEVFGRAADREHRSGGGVQTWSDPVPADGALVAVTEALLEPGAVDHWAVAPGVDVLTWVVAGELTHEDGVRAVPAFAGALLHGSCDEPGHGDRNAGGAPLRLVRIALRRRGAPLPTCGPTRAPVLVPGSGAVEVLTRRTELEATAMHLHVVDGAFSVAGTPLRPGDSVQLFTTRTLDGEGIALAWVGRQ